MEEHNKSTQVQAKKKADDVTEEEKADAQKCNDDIKKQ